MRRSYLPYLTLGITLFLLLGLSASTQNYVRGLFAKLLTRKVSTAPQEEEITTQLLQLENHTLKQDLSRIKAALGQMQISETSPPPIQAKVIYRPRASWRSSLWINVGSKKQPELKKNSPVVLGKNAIGVVDYLEEGRSRIRLITDPDLTLSVRVVRDEHFLAKGELHGQANSLGRSRNYSLFGTGFNYDFDDAYGKARDLRTGKTQDGDPNKESLHLIQEGDKLITTGMDGIFPEGLNVAIVTKIHPLQEGDFYFDIEATPTQENLDELNYVFILSNP